jgi:aminopeptidase N
MPLPVDSKTLSIEEKRDFVAHVASFDESSLLPLTFTVDNDKRKVIITMAHAVKRGQQFVLRTDSICEPDEKTLEGIYYDFTPKGAPRTMITQCQQYGFQRIVPCIDSMACKPFYTTSIVADARYTNIITNGRLLIFVHPKARVIC